MFLKVLSVPKGVAKVFMPGNYTDFLVTENYVNRPDIMLDKLGKKSIKTEMINNNLNDVSPIEVEIMSGYKIMGNDFMGYFGDL